MALSSEVIKEKICLDLKCLYNFEINNLFRDRTCCIKSKGPCSIISEDNVIATGGDFEKLEYFWFQLEVVLRMRIVKIMKLVLLTLSIQMLLYVCII